MPLRPADLPDDRSDDRLDDGALVAQHVRGLDEDGLVRLLQDRPDLLRGAPPVDLDDLAERLGAPGYAVEAIDRLDLPTHVVLSAVSFLDRGASTERVIGLLGSPADVDHVAAVRERIAQLTRLGLVVPRPSARRPDGLRSVPGVQRLVPALLGGIPLDTLLAHADAQDPVTRLRAWGLTASSPRRAAQQVRTVLTDPDLVQRIVADADDRVRRGLRELAAGTLGGQAPVHRPAGAVGTAVVWALENGLAWEQPWTAPVLPREVALALVEGEVHVPFPVDGPDLPTVPVAPETVRRAAAGAASETVTVVMGVVELLTRVPVPTRKDGSIGAREITRVAKTLKVDPRLVRFALTAANRLGLLAQASETTITTSTRAESWRRRSPAERYADLLREWWDWETLVVRDRDLEDKPTAIGGESTAPRAAEVRQVLLGHLAELPPGRGITSGPDLFARVGWARPNALFEHDAHDVEDVLAEAELVGALAIGVLTGPGHALVSGSRNDLVREADLLLPATNSRATFGSDLTALVAGNPAADVVDLLDAVAERETRGAANSWRFTDASFRDALDAGRTVEDLLDGLRGLSDKPLPQTLEYLAHDVGRRYGLVAVRPANCVLVGDEALIAELLTHSGLRKCGFTRLAPTVLASPEPHPVVLAAVRAAGYLPRDESGDGTRVALTRLDDPGAVDGEPLEEDPVAEDPVEGNPAPDPVAHALRLRAGQEPAADPRVAELARTLRAKCTHLQDSEVRQLAHAVVHRRPVHVMVQYGFAAHPEVLVDPSIRGSVLCDQGYQVVPDVGMVVTVTPVG